MKEVDLQMQICRYLKLAYPNIIFRSDFASGMRMTIGQAVRHKNMQSERGFPDLFIAECRQGYCGLMLELKNGYDKVYKKNGEFKKDKHIEEQAEIHARLIEKGYYALFVYNFDSAKQVIDYYLKQKQ
jgi:hypothetical protein